MDLILLFGSYVLGSIPTGIVVGRLAGIDPRHGGSGNIGATNVARIAGRWLGLLTLAGDALKGALPVWLAQIAEGPTWLPATVGMAAIGGHLWSCFLQFRGGKGVATALGVFLVLAPSALAIALLAFAITAAVFRFVSLASIAAAAILPLGALALSENRWVTLAAFATAAAIIGKHRDNVRRISTGTEPKFGRPDAA